MKLKFSAVLSLLILLGSAFSFAQNATQAIVLGKVQSADGPVQGATMLVKNESTGFAASLVTNKEGGYTFNQLPLGSPYSVTVSFVGYKTEKKNGLTVNQGDKV